MKTLENLVEEAVQEAVKLDLGDPVYFSGIHFGINYLASQGRIVPEGYVAVPLEPTGAMIMYGIHAHEKNDDLTDIGLGPKCVGIYKHMIKGVRHE